MIYAWVDDGQIFATTDKNSIPKNKNVVELDLEKKDIWKLTISGKGNISLRSDKELAIEKRRELVSSLLQLEKQRLQNICDQYAYNGLADVQFYASQNDQEAQAILNWYQSYDDLIWSYIDNDLSAFTDFEELLQIDMKNIEEQIYQQSIQQSPLPQEE